MTCKEAAEIIGISKQQVQQAIRKGYIPARKDKLDYAPGQYRYLIKEKDVIYYRDHRPKKGPKPRSNK